MSWKDKTPYTLDDLMSKVDPENRFKEQYELMKKFRDSWDDQSIREEIDEIFIYQYIILINHVRNLREEVRDLEDQIDGLEGCN